LSAGATPEYLAGHYMLQSAASFMPVIALAPQENERILDMASAPGGKTSYIGMGLIRTIRWSGATRVVLTQSACVTMSNFFVAALMRNTGMVFANDPSKDRCKAIIGNLHRLGTGRGRDACARAVPTTAERCRLFLAGCINLGQA